MTVKIVKELKQYKFIYLYIFLYICIHIYVYMYVYLCINVYISDFNHDGFNSPDGQDTKEYKQYKCIFIYTVHMYIDIFTEI
jgi:hypothetical protein